jgi:hypothetical protein
MQNKEGFELFVMDTCIAHNANTTPTSASKSPSFASDFLDLKDGTAYLEQEEVEPPHGAGVQGDNGAPS